MISLDAKVTIPENVLFQDLSGEMVLLDLESGKYYGLNEVGTRLFTLLSERRNVNEAYEALLEEYDVAPEQLQQDVLGLVEKLAEQKLVIIEDVQTPN
jgi:hypothetical protein